MYSNFFNNKIFLFLIILLIGFLCIGSSFAVNADSFGDVDRDGNVHLTSACDNDVIVSDVGSDVDRDGNVHLTSACDNDVIVSDMGGNVKNIKNLTIQAPTVSNKNDGSIGNSVDLKEIKGKTINNFNSSKINPPVHPIYDENDLKNALNLES